MQREEPPLRLIAGAPRLDGALMDGSLPIGPSDATRLRGRFSLAFALAGDQLLVARDGSGLHPMYHRPRSTQASLTPTDLVDGDRRLDPWALAIYVATSHMPAPHTLWASVRKCAAGTACMVTPAQETTIPLVPHFPRSRAEAARTLIADGSATAELDALAEGHALDVRAEARLEAWAAGRVLVGLRRALEEERQVLLSGGIDSAILGHLTQQATRGKLRTMTFGARPCDPWSDGVERAAPVVAALGSAHSEFVVTARDFRDGLDDYLGSLGEPSLSAYLYYLVARHLRGTGRWASGLGADEIFLGDPWYGKYQAVARALTMLTRLPRAARAALARLVESMPGGTAKRAALVRATAPDFRFLYAFCRDNLDIDERLALLHPAIRPAGFTRDDANFPHGDVSTRGLEAMQEMLLTHEFADGHGRDVSLFPGVDLSFPYLAPEVVAATLVTRPETRAGLGKPFLRRVVRSVVPEALLASPKGSFLVPPVAWLRDGLEDLVRETLDRRRLARRGIWNVAVVEERLQRFYAGTGSPFDVIRVLLLELWMERHRVTVP